MSSAEQLAREYEEGKDIETKSTGKRPKAEQIEHKYDHGDDTRKIVDNAMHGEQEWWRDTFFQKRKEQNLKK